MRDDVKFGYSKDVLSVNRLIDKGLDQIISMNNTIDKTTGGKRFEVQRETSDQVDWLIEQHERNIERIKETLKVY